MEQDRDAIIDAIIERARIELADLPPPDPEIVDAMIRRYRREVGDGL